MSSVNSSHIPNTANRRTKLLNTTSVLCTRKKHVQHPKFCLLSLPACPYRIQSLKNAETRQYSLTTCSVAEGIRSPQIKPLTEKAELFYCKTQEPCNKELGDRRRNKGTVFSTPGRSSILLSPIELAILLQTTQFFFRDSPAQRGQQVDLCVSLEFQSFQLSGYLSCREEVISRCFRIYSDFNWLSYGP